MYSGHKNKKKELISSTFLRIERMHPYKIGMYLVIAGSSLVFLFLILTFHFSRDFENFDYFRFPRAFVVSTLILLISNFTLSKILHHYKYDNLKGLSKALGLTLFLGLLFLCTQYLGWLELSSQELSFEGLSSDVCLSIIFGLHVLHYIGGLTFLGYVYYNILKMPKDPVYSLLLFTNPFEKMKLELLLIYWHFIDVLWMAIFFYFLFTF